MTQSKFVNKSLDEVIEAKRKIAKEELIIQKKKALADLLDIISHECANYHTMLVASGKKKNQAMSDLSHRINSLAKEYAITSII